MDFDNLEGTARKESQNIERDIRESEEAGFVFPVHEKIRSIDDSPTIKASENIALSKAELMRVTVSALQHAWTNAIQPRIGNVRDKGVDRDSFKSGADFFTEADTSAEKVIREEFMSRFGEDTLRIFGEEENAYLGNLDSHIGVRIDPVDGTESMKFSKPDWGIMVGIYEGSAEKERQILGAVYMPERNMLMSYAEGVGVFVTNTATGAIREIPPAREQNNLNDIITLVWRHSDVTQRGNITDVENALAKQGARVRSTASACADVLEALLTNGGRAMIMDGDFNEVDFIPTTFLEKLGYRIYTWDGARVSADDTNLRNKKLVYVPPGSAGTKILEVLQQLDKSIPTAS